MRLPKFLMLVVVLTLLCLGYVWQQTHIVHLAYEGQKRMATFQDLLDENSLLRYNLTRKTSLIAMGERVSLATDFQLPQQYCLVKVDACADQPRAKDGSRLTRQETLLARVFGLKRQAEAKAINPSTINFR